MAGVHKQVVRPGHQAVVALAGNPNTGKSTVFNVLTGLNQHTGNWSGKTVAIARGFFQYRGRRFNLVDLPGTYSLFASSEEEIITRDFLCFQSPDVTVVVADATCLERNLNLVLQIMEITSRLVVAVNLIDGAKRKGIAVDIPALRSELGVPVVAISARYGRGLEDLKRTVLRVAEGELRPEPNRVVYEPEVEAAIAEVEDGLRGAIPNFLSSRWVALCLLQGDDNMIRAIEGQREGEVEAASGGVIVPCLP